VVSPASSCDEARVNASKTRPTLGEQVGAKAALKLRAQRTATQGLWLGASMMGLIGWSVCIPTLIGAAAGIWLDKRHPGGHSWTLALLVGGLSVGCLIAWHWVAQEHEAIRREQEDPDD
jgi:ATP synthase protein I